MILSACCSIKLLDLDQAVAFFDITLYARCFCVALPTIEQVSRTTLPPGVERVAVDASAAY